MKLILGTASFGPTAYGLGKEPLGLNDIKTILHVAKRGGIKILEGAEAYHCDEVLTDLSFDLIYKVTHPYNLERVLERTGRRSLLGLLYHHGYETQAQNPLPDPRIAYLGASVYSRGQIAGSESMIEVPLNIENREFEKTTSYCKLARSVFGRGALLNIGYTVKQCLDYVKSIPNVHAVVVGVHSVKELEQILEAWK